MTNVNEYLPALKRLFTKKTELRGRVHWLQDLLKKYPAKAPAVTIEPKTDLARCRTPAGRPATRRGVMLTHYNLVAAQTMGQAAFPVFEPGKEVILAFLPFFHIYGQVVIMLNGLCHGNLLVPTEPGHRSDPGSDGALSRHGVLRRTDALRVPEGP